MNYVKLITESYFEVNTVTRFDFELKKELFQQALTRKQKVLEQKKHITEKEFLTQCGLALNEVRNHIVETLEFREHPRNSYIKNIKDNIFVDIQDIGGKSNRELSEAEFNELDKLFGFIAMLHHKTNQSQQPEPPQQTKTVNPDEALLKNEYIKIFKNDLGFTLFTKMYELYKPDNKDLANFSFLFFAMENDFLVCSQVDFVKFLEIEKYNVSIEKIDNRQFKWQINKKSKLYNSIKEPLQKKHEKSTI